jgi:hypothetical protein
MTDDSRLTEEELRKQFLQNGANFFSWNSGKNTPNILMQLNERVEKLDESLREASASSIKLATALNRLTLASVIIALLSLTAFIIFEIAKLNR